MSFLQDLLRKAKNVNRRPGAQPMPMPVRPPILNKGPGSGPMPIKPPSIGRPPPPISIGRPPSIGRPIPISGQPIQPMPIAPPGQLLPPMDPADPRGRPISGEPPSRFGPDSFYSMFPDAPQPPQMMTADMTMWTNPITGQQETGSSSMRSYQNRLKTYLDANPAAQESYTQNVTSSTPPPTNQGPVLGRPSGGRPTPPISIGGPGGGITSIGQPLDGSDPGLPKLPGGPNPPKPPPQLNDFGFGSGIIPSEIITPDGQFIGSGGVTPSDDPVIPGMINENPIPFDPNTPVDISNIGVGVGDPGQPIPSMGPPIQPKPVELNDFGFGPGIRPTEIIGPDGEFIGSGGVTPIKDKLARAGDLQYPGGNPNFDFGSVGDGFRQDGLGKFGGTPDDGRPPFINERPPIGPSMGDFPGFGKPPGMEDLINQQLPFGDLGRGMIGDARARSPLELGIEGDGLVTDPYGNRIDPNNLPDNMVLEEAPLEGRGAGMPPRAVFAPDYALQPGDPGYNQPGGGGYRPGISRPPMPPSIGGPGGGRPGFDREFDPSRPLGPGDPGYIDMDSFLAGTRPDFAELAPTPDDPISGGADLAVMVYGPDGTEYSSPGAARRAGVTDFSMSPPGASGGLQDYLNANPGAGTGASTTDPNQQPVVEPVVDPVVDPSSTTTATDPTQTQMPTGTNQIDPVLLQQATSEQVGDPLLRSLYFGTQDSPGFYNQLQQAGANLIGSDVPLQQTAGLSPMELLARQQAVAGLGGFEPFFQQNKDLVDQAIGQSRRAEALRDPYFQRAERQMQMGLGDTLGGIGQARGVSLGATDQFGRRLGDVESFGTGATGRFGQALSGIETGAAGDVGQYTGSLGEVDAIQRGATNQFGQSLGGLGQQAIGATDEFGRKLGDVEARGESAAGRFGESLGGIETGAIGATDIFGRSLGESENLLRNTLGAYDQGLTQQFYNPYEDAVVQRTIEDAMKAGDKQDIASRAREISSGAFGGSRARLGAEERREALGEGLAKALGSIRSQGYQSAQQTGLGEFARQQAAKRAASQGLSGLSGTRFGAQSGLFDRLTTGAQSRLAADKGVVDLLGRTGQQQLGAQQQLGSTLRGLTGDQLAAQRGLASGLQSTAGQAFGARSGLSDRFTSGAQARFGADQGLMDLFNRTGQQQLSAQQQLAANLMGYGSAGAGARQNLASGLLGIGQQRGSGATALGQQLAGYGSQIGGMGSSLDALRRGERGELAGYGSIGRGIAETGLGRIYQQQLGQQQRPLGVLGQIAGMLPGYQASGSQIDSQYGMPTDPTAAGLGAAFSAYGAMAPRQGQS